MAARTTLPPRKLILLGVRRFGKLTRPWRVEGRRLACNCLQARVVELEARNRVLKRQVARLAAQVGSLLKRLEEKDRSA